MRWSAVTWAVLLLLVPLAAVAQQPQVEVTNGYVRAMPPGAPNSGAFMTFENRTGQDRAVLAATGTVSDRIELHTHLNEGGMMRMRQIERIELPAGQQVELRPGGLHLMLIGLKQPLVEGDQVSLSVELDDGTRLELRLPVKRVGMGMGIGPGHGAAGSRMPMPRQ